MAHAHIAPSVKKSFAVLQKKSLAAAAVCDTWDGGLTLIALHPVAKNDAPFPSNPDASKNFPVFHFPNHYNICFLSSKIIRKMLP
jgi:hypothetical protein